MILVRCCSGQSRMWSIMCEGFGGDYFFMAQQQVHSKAAHVDDHLAVKGSQEAIYAIGDAATLDQVTPLFRIWFAWSVVVHSRLPAFWTWPPGQDAAALDPPWTPLPPGHQHSVQTTRFVFCGDEKRGGGGAGAIPRGHPALCHVRVVGRGQEHVLDHAEELFKQADLDGNGVLSPHEVPPPPPPPSWGRFGGGSPSDGLRPLPRCPHRCTPRAM